MRVTTLACAIGAAAIPVISAFLGCTGSVTAAAAGVGGASVHASSHAATTGPVGTTATGNVAVTATSTTTTSGGGNGGSLGVGGAAAGGASGAGGAGGSTTMACNQACQHAASCGFDVCGMFGIMCTNVPPMYDCILNCIDGVPCANFMGGAFACYQMCMNMGNDGGPPPNDAGCFGWLQCQGACYQQSPIDPTCFGNCDMMFPNAAPLYDPVYACTCTSCMSQCGAENPCSHVPDGG
jgi:hypothetical protein